MLRSEATSIVHAIEYPCQLREELGDARLSALLTHAMRVGGSEAGGEEFEDQAPCRGCAANAACRYLGCVGTVKLPLSAAAEEWLLARLPRDLTTAAGYTLASALVDYSWDGGYAARLRAEDATRVQRGDRARYFEDATPVALEGPLRVDSNQVFDMLFGEGHVQAGHPLLLCLFFGLVSHDISPIELGAIRVEPARIERHLDISGLQGELGGALRAVARAATLGRQFLVHA